jgi:hypothetical protein
MGTVGRKFKGSLRYTMETKEDLLRKVVVTDTCWLWTGAVSNTGYGSVQWKGKRNNVHRLMYELFVVKPTKQVLHKCDVRLCCNPDHLWEGTQTDNMRDASKKGRIRNQHGICKEASCEL